MGGNLQEIHNMGTQPATHYTGGDRTHLSQTAEGVNYFIDSVLSPTQ